MAFMNNKDTNIKRLIGSNVGFFVLLIASSSTNDPLTTMPNCTMSISFCKWVTTSTTNLKKMDE